MTAGIDHPGDDGSGGLATLTPTLPDEGAAPPEPADPDPSDPGALTPDAGDGGGDGPGDGPDHGGAHDPGDRSFPIALDTSARRYAALLAVPLAAGLALRFGLALSDKVITNDASAYLESGRNLVEGRGFVRDGGFPELHFPPGAPVLLGGVWKLTGSPRFALTAVTMVTSFLCLFPLAALARRLGGDRAGIAACWVGALAVGITAVPANAGGGSETLYLLCLLTCLWLVSTLPAREGAGVWATAALAGLAAGALYLTRPEGLLLVLVIVGVMVLSSGVVGDLRRRRLSWSSLRRQLGPAALLFAVFALCMAPYLIFLHGHTGKWEVTAKSQDANIEAWRAVAEGDRRARDEVLYELDDTGLAFVSRSRSLAALARADPGGYAEIVGTNAGELRSQYVEPRTTPLIPFPEWSLIPPPLTLVALWGAWRRRRDPVALTLVGVLGLATATCLGFFVQARYLVPAVAMLAILAGVGLVELRPAWRRGGFYGALVLLVVPIVVAIPSEGSMFDTREPVEHQIAGDWLADNAPVGARIMTRSLVTEFYSSRKAVAVPYGSIAETVRFAYHHGVEYLVVDEFLMRRFRPQLAPLFAAGPWPGLELVHELRYRDRLTRIFALDPPPPIDSPDPPGLGFVGDG